MCMPCLSIAELSLKKYPLGRLLSFVGIVVVLVCWYCVCFVLCQLSPRWPRISFGFRFLAVWYCAHWHFPFNKIQFNNFFYILVPAGARAEVFSFSLTRLVAEARVTMSGVAARASLPRRRVFQRQVGEHNPLRLFLPASGRPMILRVFQPLTGSMSEDRHAMASEFVRRVRVTTAYSVCGSCTYIHRLRKNVTGLGGRDPLLWRKKNQS